MRNYDRATATNAEMLAITSVIVALVFALRAAFTLAAGSAFIGLRFRARRNQTSAEMSRAASIASVQPSGFAAMI
jgi:hypothetical protein